MADLWLRRTPAGFVPLDAEDMLPSWKIGDTLFASIKRPRNGKLHRKAFVLLNMVFPHTEYPSKDALRAALTIGAGFVETVINPMTGEVCYTPRSWQFSHMDDDEFRELYNRMIDVALKIVPNSSRDDWEQAVDDLVRM